jgi:hypothetical protein
MPAPAAAQEFGFFGNLFVRQVVFAEAGDWLPGHEHRFDHMTFVGRGGVRVHRDDAVAPDRTVWAPAFIETPARMRHSLHALEDDTVAWCIFAVRDVDGQVLQADEMTEAARASREYAV